MNKLILFLLTLTTSLAYSQNSNIRGFVYEKSSGEPVMFCNVILKGTTIGSSTDINGMYNIAKVKPGNYTLIATYIGYDTTEIKITLRKGKILTQNLEISESSIKLNEIKISAERSEMKTDVKVAAIKISKKDLEMIPSIGGEPDLAQYMQIVPGVVFTGDQGGQLYIRGGSPIQNKVLMDGMIIYSPFHSIGLFSVFDSDIIRNTDVYTGGFSAKYGGRISSIMDIKTIDGNKKDFKGKISANTFGSKILIEGPLSKNQKTSFVFSGKTSYINKTADIFYSNPSIYNQNGLPYSYTDIYSKISLHGKNGSKLNIFGFNFQDDVDYENVSALNWNSKGIGSEFILIPGGSPVLIEGNFAYSGYKIQLDEVSSALRESSINGFNMGLDFTYFQPKSKIRYGFDIHGFSTKFSTYNIVNSEITQEENTSEFSGYVNYQYNSTRWIFEPGLRLQYYGNIGTSLEPRIGAKCIISDRLRLKLSTGIYSQNIFSTSSDRDVVNLFSGIISTDINLPATNNNDIKLQKATHLISGIEYDISHNIDFQIEGYIKDFSQLINFNRDMISNNDNEYIVESGIAKGVDVLIKYKTNKLYLWGVYSLGFITRDDGERTYYPHFDRRHNINLVSSYKFGNKKDWKIDLRWNLGSGFPFTQTQGFYESLTFSDGINTDYISNNGELGIEYADLNEGRLPYYHRLDMSLSKNTQINKTASLDITVSITNVYNRENIFYFNRVKYERVNQLPIMPSIGLSLSF